MYTTCLTIFVSFSSELNLVYKKGVILAGYLSAYSCYPIVSSFVSLFPFFMAGNHLTAQNVFTTLALLGTLQKPVTILFSYELRALFLAATTLERAESFLVDDDSNELFSSKKEEDPSHLKLHSGSFQSNSTSGAKLENESSELQFHSVEPSSLKDHSCNQSKPFLCLNNVQFRPWDDSDNLNLCIPNSQFIGITGPVGCGKSSLFHTILGEIPSAFGQIAHHGRIAYVCQTPWVFSGTVRENIIFGKEFNHDDFQRAIEVCSLKEDLISLPCGDLTYVGEHGVTLSGGQRARVNLARAVYFDADIYLLDDPLSAVDVKVSNEIFQKCICGTLSDRIRLLISHQPCFLRKTDPVLFMDKEGKLTKGSYKQLCALGTFSEISTLTSIEKGEEEKNFPSTQSSYRQSVTDTVNNSSGLEIEDEDRLTGSVSYPTYWRYLSSGMSKLFMVIMGALVIWPEGKKNKNNKVTIISETQTDRQVLSIWLTLSLPRCNQYVNSL